MKAKTMINRSAGILRHPLLLAALLAVPALLASPKADAWVVYGPATPVVVAPPPPVVVYPRPRPVVVVPAPIVVRPRPVVVVRRPAAVVIRRY